MNRAAVVALILLSVISTASGQGYDTSPGAQTGRLPFSSYFDADIDSISLYNGNLSLNIPILTLPGRELSTGLRAVYNAQAWQLQNFLQTEVGVYTGGWRLSDPIGELPLFRKEFVECNESTDFARWAFWGYWVDGMGTKRTFLNPDIEVQDCENPDPTIPSSESTLDSTSGDGATLQFVSPDPAESIVRLASGVVIHFLHTSATIRTRNGNYLERGSNGLLVADTLDRTIAFTTTKVENPQDPTYYNRYTVTGGNEQPQAYTFHYEYAHQVWDPYGSQLEDIPDWLIAIDLPNTQSGHAYVFEYDQTCSYGSHGNQNEGYLTKVTLPSGGYIEYSYSCAPFPGNYPRPRYDRISERRVSRDEGEAEWTYEMSNETSESTGWARDITVVSPEGSAVVHRFNAIGLEYETQWKESDDTLVRKEVRTWANDGVEENGQPINPRLSEVKTILGDVQRKTTFEYHGTDDPASRRVVQRDDSDWYTGESVINLMRTVYRYFTDDYNYSGAELKHYISSVELHRWAGSAYEKAGETRYFYDQGANPATSGTYTPVAPESTGSEVPQKGDPTYSMRMNTTTVRRWASAGTSIDERMEYDDTGNVIKRIDGMEHITEISYADNFVNSSSQNSFAFPTGVTVSVSSGTSFTTTTAYDYNTGLIREERGLVLQETELGKLTAFTYDGMNRLKTTTYPNGLIVTIDYDDINLKITETADLGSDDRKTETYLDELFRPIKTVDKDPAGDITVETEYDGNGRVKKVSAPYRGGDTIVWTQMLYDAIDRPTTIANPGSTTRTSNYSGNTVTQTDEAGNQRRMTSNGLGQLVKVEEPNPEDQNPSLNNPLATGYTYSVTGALEQVCQYLSSSGACPQTAAQKRTFTNDWLGRVSKEVHPESGRTFYDYDDAGRVTDRYTNCPDDTKTNCVVHAEYAYDNIGRLTQTSYNDGTATVSRVYDENGHLGSLTTMTDAAGTLTMGYDADTGDLLSETRALSGGVGTYTTAYEYFLDGKLKKVTYPSQRVVDYTYASANGLAADRLNTLVDATTSTTLVQNVSHSTELISRTLGSTIIDWHFDNDRRQLTRIHARASGSGPSLMDLNYEYENQTSANNGQIRKRIDGLQPEHSAEYEYKVRRLNKATSNSSWSIEWTVDAYGNRRHQTATGLAAAKGVANATNITYIDNKNEAFSHDYSGNVTLANQQSYAYDGEGWLKSFNGGAVQYVYDGDGRRIKRITNDETTYYLYGLTGLLSEFTTMGTGASQAQSSDRLAYRVAEHNGTSVLSIAANGTIIENNRTFPYGEPWEVTNLSTIDDKFTTYDRDSATDLDYAMARFYANRSGRFMTPDPSHVGADPSDPQSWNAYVYTLNDPLNYTDPLGLEAISKKECEENPKCVRLPINLVIDEPRRSARWQDTINRQLQHARNAFGTLGIYLDVSVTKGRMDSNRITKGDTKCAFNVGVSNAEGMPSSFGLGPGHPFARGLSGTDGVPYLYLTMALPRDDSLSHELAHHLSGDTGLPLPFALVWAIISDPWHNDGYLSKLSEGDAFDERFMTFTDPDRYFVVGETFLQFVPGVTGEDLWRRRAKEFAAQFNNCK